MTGPLEGGDVWGPGRAPHGASPPSSGPTSLPGPLEPDPRGWEALTQQEAERDVVRREMRDLAEQTIDATLPYEETWYTNAANVVDLLALLEVAERERDQAREALRRISDGDHIQPTLRCDIRGCDCAQVIARAALGES